MKTFISFFIFTILMITLRSTSTHAATFEIQNNCSYTVWAAAVPGGGRKLYTKETWSLDVANGAAGGRIWARTNCTFNTNGRGSCQAGDCDGVLECRVYGAPPITMAEYALGQFNNLDFLDISLVEGFNVPMKFSRPTDSCTGGISCSADINTECPEVLQAPGGCNNPCTVFKTDQYCCTSGNNCGPTNYSKLFKAWCPDFYSYPKDDQTSTFTCPGGSNYRVVFCPDPEQLPTGTATFYTPPYVPSSCFGFQDNGVMIAPASEAIWDNRAACGRNYRVTCTGPTNQGVPQPCRGSVLVKVVDYCPPGCEGTIDLSQEAFAIIADPNAGQVNIEYDQD